MYLQRVLKVKIGTWNVEYGRGERNARRLAKLREHDADVWVLTETHDEVDLSETHEAIRTERRYPSNPSSFWTTIWTRRPCLERIDTVDRERTVAARLELAPGQDLIVYGTVLPWNGDAGPDKSRQAKGWAEFDRVVPEQGKEWTALRQSNPDSTLVVAGDLNQSLGQKHYYGTIKAGSCCASNWQERTSVVSPSTSTFRPTISSTRPSTMSARCRRLAGRSTRRRGAGTKTSMRSVSATTPVSLSNSRCNRPRATATEPESRPCR